MVEVSTPVIAGNWKMHKTPSETRAFFQAFLALHPASERSVLFFPPALSFESAVRARGDRTDIQLGVQDIHWEKAGAFTGALSAAMAADAGAAFALVGHSERRHVFGETEEETGRKTAAAFREGLLPVLCVGEKLEERRAGRVEEIILRQLDGGLESLHDDQVRRSLIAYEPVWAIGTGETATPQHASEAHGALRQRLRQRIGDSADQVPILYGGSVKPGNAEELLAAPHVDGVLVGGASLDPEAFAAIARS